MIVDSRKIVRVRQLNAGRRIITHDLLMMWLSREVDPHIICLQEPYITGRGLSRLPRTYTVFWSNVDSIKYSRVCIIAPTEYGGYMVSQLSDTYRVVVRFPMLNLTLASIYCDINTCATQAFNGIESEIEVSRNMVICVDTNAHNAAWGSVGSRSTRVKSYFRGDQLIDLFDNLNLNICNDTPHKPTYVGSTGYATHIDVTLCTADIMHRIGHWNVRNETFDSDHRAIDITVHQTRECNKEVINPSKGVLWRKPSFKMLGCMNVTLPKLVKFTRRVGNERDVDIFIQRHTDEIRGALEKLFVTRERTNNPSCYWWTDEVSTAHRKMKKARRRMGRYKHTSLVEDYNHQRRIFRKKVREAKIDAWREFMTKIDDPWKGLMRILDSNKQTRKQSKTLCSVDGVYAADLSNTLKLVSDQFYPPPMEYLDIHREIEIQVDRKLLIQDEFEKIIKCEFRTALRQMSKATAPGADGVTNSVLQILAKKCRYENQYIQLFNTCLPIGVFPNAWKVASIILIPKAHDILNSVKSLRPISLVSVFSKLLERVVLVRILHHIELSGQLSLSQHAYRKGGSTTTALYEMAKFIQNALHDKQVCVMVFLDISGAFDRTWHGGILHRLLQYGVPCYLVRWVKSFLTNRTAIFQEGRERHTKILHQGCPQGGVLSPVLWNVLFNDMLVIKIKADQRFHLKIVGYADDAAILCRSGTVANASAILTKHLLKIKKWVVENRVQMNSTKLKVIVISRRTTKAPAYVYYDGKLVSEVTQYKYLGLIFDSAFSWKPHAHRVIEKLTAVTRMLRGAVRETWGVRMAIIRMIFKTIFCPIILYGAVIWGWKMIGVTACA